MITTALAAFVFMLAMIAAMAIGVLAGRKPLKGSCGGLNQMTGQPCAICGADPARCERENAAAARGADLGYEVGDKRR